jgi:hypothetical protein
MAVLFMVTTPCCLQVIENNIIKHRNGQTAIFRGRKKWGRFWFKNSSGIHSAPFYVETAEKKG